MIEPVELPHDSPLDAASNEPSDLLGHAGVLTTLKRAIISVSPPSCIAVYGSWGSGKTTLLRSARADLQSGDDAVGWVPCGVMFDPWEYERREDLLSPLINTILEEVRKLRGDPDLSDRLKQIGLGISKTALSMGARIGIAALSGGILPAFLESLKPLPEIDSGELSKHFSEWKQFHDDVRETKRRFKELTDAALKDRPPETRMVVFLDDLDRCLPDTAVSLIEAVKLLLCGDHGTRAVFVFALDREVIGEAIRHRYPGASSYTGESYLEKIFDLSLEVPPARIDRMVDFVRQQFKSDAVQRLDDTLATGAGDGRRGGVVVLADCLAKPPFRNPRVVKRTLSRLQLLLAVDSCRAAATSIDGAAKERFIYWVAGCERFRSFRLAFHRATTGELVDLIIGEGRTAAQRSLAESPDFRRYLELIGLQTTLSASGSAHADAVRSLCKVAVERERVTTASTDGPSTLADFDALLHAAGL